MQGLEQLSRTKDTRWQPIVINYGLRCNDQGEEASIQLELRRNLAFNHQPLRY
ncbi:hypothetical protein J1N35_025390, partial [Gossypium stocksii]